MRLIDADYLKEQIQCVYDYEYPTATGAFDEFVVKIIPAIVNNAPTVESESVIHGHWINTGHDKWSHYQKCSICGKLIVSIIKTNYCPNCGAKMDVEKK